MDIVKILGHDFSKIFWLYMIYMKKKKLKRKTSARLRRVINARIREIGIYSVRKVCEGGY